MCPNMSIIFSYLFHNDLKPRLQIKILTTTMAITGRGRFYLVASLAMLATIVFLTSKSKSFNRTSVTELQIFPEVLEEDEDTVFHKKQGDILYDPHGTISLSSENKTDQDFPPTENMEKEAGNCRQVQFSKRKLPLTYLSSSPGSGNTWVRHLLQQATGKYSKQSLSGSIIGAVELVS